MKLRTIKQVPEGEQVKEKKFDCSSQIKLFYSSLLVILIFWRREREDRDTCKNITSSLVLVNVAAATLWVVWMRD